MTSSFAANFETTSVAFLPLAEGQPEGNEAPVDLSRFPMARRIVTRLENSLAQLARRARRLGPVDGGAVVLLTGCQAVAGCSTLALALAATACRDERTALVDADFHQAGLTRQLSQPPDIGWEDVVQGRSFEDAGHSLDSQGSLSFFPLGAPLADPDELLTSPGLAGWLARLRQDFALSFVDGGSLLTGGAKWAPWVDAALVVCRSGPELAEDWARAWDQLEEGGTHVLGIIETFV